MTSSQFAHQVASTTPTNTVSLLQRRPLAVNTPGDRYEREADRVADAVVSGQHQVAPFLFSAVPITRVQREDAAKEKTDEEKYKEGARKLGEAFLGTPLGKDLAEKAKQDKLVKGATEAGKSFIGTLPGKIITGAAAAGAVATLAAMHKELPAQIPEIPLDELTPGLSVEITYRGPVDKPSEAMITFKFTEQAPKGSGDKKPAMTASEKFRAETARIAADQAKFKAGMKYPPGSPEDLQQKAEEAAAKSALAKYAPGPDLGAMIKKYPWLDAQPPKGGPQLTPLTPSFGYKPPALLGDEYKLKLPDEKKKEDEPALQRKAADDATVDAAPPVVHEVLQSPGQPLDAGARAFLEPRLGHDFSQVRVHTDARAAESARAVKAVAYTVGRDIVFAAGQHAPGSQRGRHLLAHELAHTLQQNAAGRIARKSLTDLPEATRTVLKISRAAVQQSAVDPWIKNYFNPRSGISVNSSITTEFGAEITDANQQKGLRSIAIELISLSQVVVTPATQTEPETRSNTDPEKWPLPANSIYDLALDLRPYGGEHAIFRFTRYTEAGNDKVLIEKTQVLAAATPTAAVQAPTGQPQPAAGAAATFTGTVSVGNVKVQIDSSFGNDRGKVVADAVLLLPNPIRAKIDGVTITFAGSGKGPGGQNGDYKAEEDKVRLWGDLFDNSPRRVGAATNTAYEIVHELGHAVDLRPEFQAQRARDKAEAAKKKLEHDLKYPQIKADSNDPLAGLDGEKDPAIEAEKTRLRGEIAKLDKEIDTQNKGVASAKSIAGAELGKDSEALLTEFGKALAADGVTVVPNAKKRNLAVEVANEKAAKANTANPAGPHQSLKSTEKTLTTGLSNYAATDLMEAYAENFSIYVLDEALLKAIRPKTYAYFAKALPKAVGAKP